MSLLSTLSLFAILLVLALVPSASVALVVTRSAVHGVRDGAAVSAGIVLGDLLFASLAILGMTYLAEVLGSVFAIFKYLGGAWLIWLGIGLLRAPARLEIRPEASRPSTLATSFLAGLILTLGDIKAILFYASLFPAFVDLEGLSVSGIALIMAITVLTVGGVKLGYACAARGIVRRLQGRVNGRWARRAGGGMMIGSGTWLMVKG